MTVQLAKMLKPLFPLSAEAFPKMAAERFGSHEDMDKTWHTFEPVARTLVDSFYMTLDNRRHDRLVRRLDAVEPELRGIAYEGAGMGLALLDCLLPTKKRLVTFLHGPGAPYRCLVYIGAGLVLPRIPMNPVRFLARHDPFLRWFMMDGYGFYEGFFSWREAIEKQQRPRPIRGYATRAFDHGLGRSLWFSTGANVARIIDTINTFPAQRQGDLWSGIGLACAYAAGVMDREAITVLLDAAGDNQADLAVGAAIASIFREHSGQTAPHTDLACEVVWGSEAPAVAAVAHDASRGLRHRDTEPAYEQWRRTIRSTWQSTPHRSATRQEAQA